tara:strand:- start:576 stop:830 length:255 start_codon:yes stop_codon:yes gene_type:complete
MELINSIKTMDEASIELVIKAINSRRNEIQLEAKQQFSAGDRVKFEYKNCARTGVVIKTMKKNILVMSMNSNWRIDPTLLTKIN